MDIIDILLASGFKSSAIKAATERANAAASEATAAASAANDAAGSANTAASSANDAATAAYDAISAIYHDKNFLLSVNADKSLTLSYDPEAINTEEE